MIRAVKIHATCKKPCGSDPAIGQLPRAKESAIYESDLSEPSGTHRLLQQSPQKRRSQEVSVTTLQIYTHAVPETMSKAEERLAQKLMDPNGPKLKTDAVPELKQGVWIQ